jgi:hypothetical protein
MGRSVALARRRSVAIASVFSVRDRVAATAAPVATTSARRMGGRQASQPCPAAGSGTAPHTSHTSCSQQAGSPPVSLMGAAWQRLPDPAVLAIL